MTRKTFFKTILGAVGGISVIKALSPEPKNRFPEWTKEETLALAKKIRDRTKSFDIRESIAKGAKQAQDVAINGGDHTKTALLSQEQSGMGPGSNKANHRKQDWKVLAELEPSHWQVRASKV
jgi:hypothetical protein